MASSPRSSKSSRVRPEYVRPFHVGDWAKLMLGKRVMTRGMIVEIVKQEDGYTYAWLLIGPGEARYYPMWQLIPDGITWFTFRHVLFAVLKVFNKELALD